jgi:hypothetical protein
LGSEEVDLEATDELCEFWFDVLCKGEDNCTLLSGVKTELETILGDSVIVSEQVVDVSKFPEEKGT